MDSGSNSFIGLYIITKVLSYPVSCSKSDTPNIISQLIWIFLHHFYTVIAVCFIDSYTVCSGYTMGLKKNHDILDFLLLLPGCFYHLYPFGTDSLHLKEPLCFLLYYPQCILLESLYNPPGIYRANSLNKPAAQIFFDSGRCCRQPFFKV